MTISSKCLKSTIYFLVLIFVFTVSCNQSKPPKATTAKVVTSKTIKLLPLGNVDKVILSNTYNSLVKFLPKLEILSSTKMPSIAYYKPRDRYRADSLIHWLNSKAKVNEIYVGITGVDISATKGIHEDWGVMGLSYIPGKACVVSYARLKDKSTFYKVVIHEIGHTMGLPHCPNKTCFMRDADGKDTTGEEKEFCQACKARLIKSGWNL
jgi:archaemetzincin